MHRWTLAILGSTVVLGLAAAHPLLTNLRVDRRAAHDAAYAQTYAQLVGLADVLHLYRDADPRFGPAVKVILSDFPLPPERVERLVMHHPDPDRWRGTVAIYLGLATMAHLNADPDHPERWAVWNGNFLYGDPELIARLVSAVP